MSISEIIINLDLLIQSVVYGAVYIIVFRFSTYNKLNYSNSAFVIKSIIVNFLFVQLFEGFITFPSANSVESLIFSKILFSAIVAYIVSNIYKSSIVQNLLHGIGIRRSLTNDFILDIMPINRPTLLITKHESCKNVEGAEFLIGSIDKIESDDTKIEERHITLTNYCYVTKDNETIKESHGKKMLIKIGDCKDFQFFNVEGNADASNKMTIIKQVIFWLLIIILLCMVA